MEYKEIIKLKNLLEKNHIPFTWHKHLDGYHLCYKGNGNFVICSVIENDVSYGHEQDKLEIMGLLSDDEEVNDNVLGNLTAENVFERIENHWKFN